MAIHCIECLGFNIFNNTCLDCYRFDNGYEYCEDEFVDSEDDCIDFLKNKIEINKEMDKFDNIKIDFNKKFYENYFMFNNTLNEKDYSYDYDYKIQQTNIVFERPLYLDLRIKENFFESIYFEIKVNQIRKLDMEFIRRYNDFYKIIEECSQKAPKVSYSPVKEKVSKYSKLCNRPFHYMTLQSVC